MSTLNVDYPNQNRGPVGKDGLNDYQRAHLKNWIDHRSTCPDDYRDIMKAVKVDPRMLYWADWPTMANFGRWLFDEGIA